MTTIPDDIMQAAMEAYLSLMDDDRYDDHKYGSEHIARAIMAERERAAKVADSRIVEGDAEYLAGWRRAAEIIGNDIRKGDRP